MAVRVYGGNDEPRGVVAVLRGAGIRCVSLVGLGCHFGGTVVLRGLDGAMAAGRLHQVVGANGSGKSTLLRIMAGLLRPSFGFVSYDPPEDPVDFRHRLGWLAHEALAYPDLTGLENLRLASSLRGVADAVALAEVVARFSLGRFVDRPVRTLSRGQRQRLALARSLSHRPSLAFLDEPTTGLDAEGVSLLCSLLRDLVRDGAVVVVVTHDPEVFASLDSETWHLDRGRWAG